MGTGHTHGPVRAGHEKMLWGALALTTTFLIAEVIGAFITGSLALLSDAAHMFTDAAALAISLAAMQKCDAVGSGRNLHTLRSLSAPARTSGDSFHGYAGHRRNGTCD